MRAFFAATAASAALVAMFSTTAVAQLGQLPANMPAVRFDPYKNYKFRVEWDGRIIQGITRVGPLTRSTQVITVTQGTGGQTIKTPGRAEYDAITLEREVTRDPAFEAWVDATSSPNAPPQSFRKDVQISIYDESGRQLLIAYRLFACWPTAYTAISGIEADPPAPPLQRLTLTCTAWDRDRSAGNGP